MGKMIAVWGTPNSGKTALSIKLAESLYLSEKRKKLAIVVVLCDVVAPSIPVVFPNNHSDEIYSIGDLLAKTTLTADDIFAYTMSIRGKENLGILGYKDNENCHSHPAYNRDKAMTFYNILRANTDYIIVDCMTDPDMSILTETALTEADKTVFLSTPDLKCLSYSMSQLPHFITRGYIKPTQLSVMNVPFDGHAMPVADARSHLGKIVFTLPYSSALSEQSVEGRIGEELRDRKFMQVVQMIVERVR